MSLAKTCLTEIDSLHQFFNRSTSELTEDMAAFAPAEGMMTTTQQIVHAAHTIEWFVEGAFRPEGFDMDFESHMKLISGVSTIAEARAWFEKAVANAKAVIGAKSDAELMTPMPPGPIMGGEPAMAIIGAMVDHTAHHRGALTVYARVKGKVPPMPYM